MAVANGINPQFPGVIASATDQAITAGGALVLNMGNAASPNIYIGSGAPTITANKGSLYIRTDGSSTSTRMYINTTGLAVWTNFTTAA